MTNIIIDPTVLGDRLPRDKDSIARLKERNKALRDPFRLKGNQKALDNKEASQGASMQPSDFIRRLQKMSPKLIIEQGGFKNAVRVCIPAIDDDPLSETYGQLVKQPLACGFCTDQPLPEFSYVINDKDGIPYREVRGWRTVLLRLIHTGVVTYADVKAEFGEPFGQRNALWMEQMQERRA